MSSVPLILLEISPRLRCDVRGAVCQPHGLFSLEERCALAMLCCLGVGQGGAMVKSVGSSCGVGKGQTVGDRAPKGC